MNVAEDIEHELRAYAWPQSLARSLHTGEGGFEIDFETALSQVPGTPHATQPLVLTVVTEDYLPIFDRWLNLARRAGLSRFLVGYIGTSSVAEHLRRRDVPNFRIGTPEPFRVATSWRNKGDFSVEGAAAIHARTVVAHQLVIAGLDVLYCDVDAWILRWPSHLEDVRVDVAFQRVAYFPAPVVDRWGFALCGGFIFFRASPRTAEWLHQVCDLMLEVSSDQLAFNVALLRQGATWAIAADRRGAGEQERESNFARRAALPIAGELAPMGLNLLALPATLYWRHAFVEPNRENWVLMHPNTSKNPVEKLLALSRWADDSGCVGA